MKLGEESYSIMKELFLGLFLMLLTVVCLSDVARATEKNLQKEFIKHLYGKGYYFRAITEAERFIFFYPKSPYIEEMIILIADSYASGGDSETALRQYINFLEQYPNSIRTPQVYFKAGKIYAESRNYSTAKRYFEEILLNNKSSEFLINKAKKWIVLLSLLLDLPQNNIQEIMYKFELLTNDEILDKVKKYNSLNFKSPKVAGTLSALFPGAGQLYLNRKKDATAAFILNGIFIWGIIESFNNDNAGIGVLLSLFEIGWYGGNIYTAINGAYKHNRKLKDSFRNNFTIGLNIYVGEYNEVPPKFIFSFNYHY